MTMNQVNSHQQKPSLITSNTQHLTKDKCLQDNSEDDRTVLLCCTVYYNCAQ